MPGSRLVHGLHRLLHGRGRALLAQPGRQPFPHAGLACHLLGKAGDAGQLLRPHADRRAAEAIAQLLAVAGPRLPCLLGSGAEAPQRHGGQGAAARQQGRGQVSRHLRPGDAHVHRELPQGAEPLLGLLHVPGGALRQTIRRRVGLARRLQRPRLLGLGVLRQPPDGLLIAPDDGLEYLPLLLRQGLSLQVLSGVQHGLVPGVVLPQLPGLPLVLVVLDGGVEPPQPLHDHAAGVGVARPGALGRTAEHVPRPGPEGGPGSLPRLLRAPCHLLVRGASDAQHHSLPRRRAGRLRRFARLSLLSLSGGRCFPVHGLDSVQPLQGVPARRGLGRFPLRGLRRSFPRVIHRPDLIQPVKYICHLLLLRRPGRPESRSAPPESASRWLRSSSACGPAPG